MSVSTLNDHSFERLLRGETAWHALCKASLSFTGDCHVNGSCKYTGKAMKESHAHLNISESLDKYKVPAAEQKELFDTVGKTRATSSCGLEGRLANQSNSR